MMLQEQHQCSSEQLLFGIKRGGGNLGNRSDNMTASHANHDQAPSSSANDRTRENMNASTNINTTTDTNMQQQQQQQRSSQGTQQSSQATVSHTTRRKGIKEGTNPTTLSPATVTATDTPSSPSSTSTATTPTTEKPNVHPRADQRALQRQLQLQVASDPLLRKANIVGGGHSHHTTRHGPLFVTPRGTTHANDDSSSDTDTDSDSDRAGDADEDGVSFKNDRADDAVHGVAKVQSMFVEGQAQAQAQPDHGPFGCDDVEDKNNPMSEHAARERNTCPPPTPPATASYHYVVSAPSSPPRELTRIQWRDAFGGTISSNMPFSMMDPPSRCSRHPCRRGSPDPNDEFGSRSRSRSRSRTRSLTSATGVSPYFQPADAAALDGTRSPSAARSSSGIVPAPSQVEGQSMGFPVALSMQELLQIRPAKSNLKQVSSYPKGFKKTSSSSDVMEEDASLHRPRSRSVGSIPKRSRESPFIRQPNTTSPSSASSRSPLLAISATTANQSPSSSSPSPSSSSSSSSSQQSSAFLPTARFNVKAANPAIAMSLTFDKTIIPQRRVDVALALNTHKIVIEDLVLHPPKAFFTLRVANLSFEKMVTIRHTYDHWRTVNDLHAKYLPGTSDPSSDRFHATMEVPFTLCQRGGYNSKELATHVKCECEFALCYRVGGDEYWNNNNGKNFKIQVEFFPEGRFHSSSAVSYS